MLKRLSGTTWEYLSIYALESRLPVHLIGREMPPMARGERDTLVLEGPGKVRC